MNFLESSLKPKKSVWYYIGAVIIAFFSANMIGAIPLVVVMFIRIFEIGFENLDPENMQDLMTAEGLGISSNFYLILMLIPFVIGLLTLILLFKPFTNKTYKEVINGTNKIRWNRVFWGAGIWLFLSAIYLFADYITNPGNFVLQFDIAAFIPLVIIAIILIPIQTSFEEMAFRGYLTQGIAGATGSRWWALIIPSVLFGLLHSFNPEIAEHGFLAMMPQYIFFGLLFGIMAILDDGIEIALGIHAANNTFLCLFVTNSSSVFQTAAVFEQQSIHPYKELIALVAMGLLAFTFFYKKYKWDLGIMSQKVSIQTPPPFNGYK